MMGNDKKLTKEERIAARRARVQAKRNKDDSKFKGDKEEDRVAKISKTKAKVAEARDMVDRTHLGAIDKVTDIMVSRDYKENQRARKESSKRDERFKELEKELLESTKINREIEMKWADIAQKDIPQELYQEIAVQYKAASKLLASKDEIVKQLQTELKVKDEDYVELLAQHHDDIQAMTKHMKDEFLNLQGVCKKELEEAESVAIDERAQLIRKNRTEIEELFSRRINMEKRTMEEKRAREEDFQAELTKIRSTDAEDYNNLKVVLENNIQLLEQQLEEMRATYQLNTEKLDYNHSVLEERDSENKQTVQHHNQRLRRLKEALSSHKQRFFKQDSKFKAENTDLTDEYKRVTEQFKDLQRKFRHFETVDNRKYREVWGMNEANVMELVRKVLKADAIVNEQILGIGTQSLFADAQGRALDVQDITSSHIFNSGNIGNGSRDEPTLTVQIEGGTIGGGQSRFSNEQIRAVTSMLVSEAHFLVDSRLKDSLRGMSEDEADMHCVDAILNSLGVEDMEDLDELVGCFYHDDPKADQPSIHPNDIIGVVKDFVVQRQQSKSSKPGAGDGSVGGMKTDVVTNEKKARKRERERRFWEKLGEVISTHSLSVWEALEKAQRRYNTLLEARAQAIDDTTDLAKQNEELKILLQEYLGSKINQDLQIPPTRLISKPDM